MNYTYVIAGISNCILTLAGVIFISSLILSYNIRKAHDKDFHIIKKDTDKDNKVENISDNDK